MTAPVTLILPLNGRPLHTLRLMFHLNKVSFPYPLLIADGRTTEPVSSILEDKSNFPTLQYTYVRYPTDNNYTNFYHKMADATARVRTPYAMLIDNDDFPIAMGILANVSFLNHNHDYVSCGSGVAGFSLKSCPRSLADVSGTIDRLESSYTKHYQPCDLATDNTWMRVKTGYERYLITFYHVYRTEALLKLHTELHDLNFSDLTLHESYLYLRTYIMGKVRAAGDTISYIRQHGTSTPYTHRTDWAVHLLQSSYTSDFHRLQDYIARFLTSSSYVTNADVQDWLLRTYACRLRNDLQNHFYIEHRYISFAKKVAAPAIYLRRGLKKISEKNFSKKLDAIINTLAKNGATATMVETFRAEMNAIEETLTGPDLLIFLRDKAPSLIREN